MHVMCLGLMICIDPLWIETGFCSQAWLLRLCRCGKSALWSQTECQAQPKTSRCLGSSSMGLQHITWLLEDCLMRGLQTALLCVSTCCMMSSQLACKWQRVNILLSHVVSDG